MRSKIVAVSVVMLLAGFAALNQRPASAGEITPGYKVLEPIRHGNLTIFPVVAARAIPPENSSH